MGFFDFLFGEKKTQAPAKQKKTAALPAATPVSAISSSISLVMNDAEIIAAIAAAVHHAGGAGTGLGLRIKRSSNVWAVAGRQKVMDSRQFA